MQTRVAKIAGLVCAVMLTMAIGVWAADDGEGKDQGLLESLSLGYEPSTTMNLTEVTNIPAPVGDVASKSKVDFTLWTLGATVRLPGKFKLSLSYARGNGSDANPSATVGGAPVPIGSLYLHREEYEIGVLHPLYEVRQQEGATSSLRVVGELGYHKTVFNRTASRNTYQGVLLGVNVTKPLSPQWTAELAGHWMPSLSGGDTYDTVKGSGTAWSLGAVYTPPKGKFFYRLAWKQFHNSGDTTDAAALASIPGATRFSFDENTSGLFLSVGMRLQ